MNIGKTAPAGILNAGLIYYLQYKVTNDRIPVPVLGIVESNKDSVGAIRAVINYFHSGCKTFGGLGWLAEVDAINRFQGNTFFLTLAHVFRLKKE